MSDSDNFNEDKLKFIRHELKNPLSTVKMITYILDKKVSESGLEDLKKHIAKIDENIDRVVDLIDRHLDKKK
jgi:nitrogen-specific signal transduction histidine kinase